MKTLPIRPSLLLLALCTLCLLAPRPRWRSGSSTVYAAPISKPERNSECEHVSLVAAAQKLELGGAQIGGLPFNNNFAGPLLRVRPGGTLCVTLTNHLQQSINLHFHGILASPLGRSDNMMIEVEPGKSFDYLVKVPTWQTPGLYWYHTHVHGSTEQGVLHGLSGPLLVDGAENQFERPRSFQQKIFVLKEYRERRASDPILREQYDGRLFTINGEVQPTLRLRPGEWQLWHLGNFGPNRPFQLSIQGHPMVVVGRDGVPVLHPYAVNDLTVDPGSRYEVLVHGMQAGIYPVMASDDDGDDRTGRQRGGSAHRRNAASVVVDQYAVGTLVVDGTPEVEMPMPKFRPTPAEDLSAAHIDAYRSIVFAQDDRRYTINGRTFDHDRVDTRVPLGNIEQWTIQNASAEMHVFHIHQVNFQVMDRNGRLEPFNGYVDTVRIPPFQSVTVRIGFTRREILGRFMYHCHVMEHEDRGMMAQIEVYDPKQGSGEISDGSMRMRP